eukprot:TRINITY_DN332_c0_g3_i1.p1 TRINITY_DN332_c0_g3~~TRINITY_DN332_c0_g3_i1.p1  ORF type:complete len:205 (-),score=46.79 TRINITY_DN332_c0_g3_i1:165-779(-)
MSRRLPPELHKRVLGLYKRTLRFMFDNFVDRELIAEKYIPLVRAKFLEWPTTKDHATDGRSRYMTVDELNAYLDFVDDKLKRVFLIDTMKYTYPENPIGPGNVHERYPEDVPYARAFFHYYPDESVHLPHPPPEADINSYDEHGHHDHAGPSVEAEFEELFTTISNSAERSLRLKSFAEMNKNSVSIVELRKIAGKEDHHAHHH